jgi:hypothetical protein
MTDVRPAIAANLPLMSFMCYLDRPFQVWHSYYPV